MERWIETGRFGFGGSDASDYVIKTMGRRQGGSIDSAVNYNRYSEWVNKIETTSNEIYDQVSREFLIIVLEVVVME